jgi:hypothetical protein
MGSQSTKAAEDLVNKLATARRRLDTDAITFQEAQQVLHEVEAQVNSGQIKFKDRDLQAIQTKLGELRSKIDIVVSIEEDERREEEESRRQAQDLENQLEKGRETGNLVALFSYEFGSQNPVAGLLAAGRNFGGYRIPKQGLQLQPIADDVHFLACEGGGFSNYKSTANGLVNRIREQSAIVVKNAYKAGYPVEHDEVQKAMAVLAKEIAYTLSSDSGGREEKPEDLARGMAYNVSAKVPGVDPSLLAGGYSNDPAVKLKSHRQALVALGMELQHASGERETALKRQKEWIEREIKDLEAKLANK